MKYPFILEQSRLKEHSVQLLCKVMKVTPTAYYAWKRQGGKLTANQIERARQAVIVREIFERENRKVGSRPIVIEMKRRGIRIGRRRVQKLMREQGLVCCIRRSYRACRKGSVSGLVFANNAQIAPAGINEFWVTDITYIRVTEGWSYYCAVMDAYSRRIIGYSYSRHIKSNLVVQALRQAARQRGGGVGTIIHSDRGCQFTSTAWHTCLRQYGMVGSMCGVGNCYDNAKMERFFGSLKDALVKNERLVSTESMADKLESWVVKYNYRRPHSALNYQTPVNFEQKLMDYIV